MTERITDNLYRITVPLPLTPLKELNAYLVRGDRNLLIDTGFNTDVCFSALTQGLEELGASPENTDIFITHLHADHAGLAYKLQRPGTKVYVSAGDFPGLDADVLADYWAKSDIFYCLEGFPHSLVDKLPMNNVARAFAAPVNCGFTFVNDGDTLQYGGFTLECVSASGHTPGQMCLYIREAGVMFLADHILFDITPNIVVWETMPNALEVYLDSLKRFSKYDIRLPLPGHRGVSCTAAERIEQITSHHILRLDEAFSVVSAEQDMTAYQIASRMTWRIKADSWEDFPTGQQWFATGEVLAHLRYLEDEGKILRYMDGDTARYCLNR